MGLLAHCGTRLVCLYLVALMRSHGTRRPCIQNRGRICQRGGLAKGEILIPEYIVQAHTKPGTQLLVAEADPVRSVTGI